ncbi:hypothetical protein [Mycolicibacterium sp.]|uniref:hypothetical protein n=1 Tax=Mycolicibacterium sp. TaxID=2320850 RepID=UPI00355DD421
MARLQCIRCAKTLTHRDAYVLPKRRQAVARPHEDPVVCDKHFYDLAGYYPRSSDTLWVQMQDSRRRK